VTDITERIGKQNAKQNFVFDDQNVHGDAGPSGSSKSKAERKAPQI
jgi:hypothetical protein